MTLNNSSSFLFISALIGILSFIGCNEDGADEVNVEINFTLTYDGNPIPSFQQVPYPLGYDVFFTKYSLFLSDIRLKTSEGNLELSEVEFLDLLTNVNTEDLATRGKNFIYQGIPSGTYNGLSMNIGVPANINQTQPSEYDSSNPLSNNGEYWVGWSSYIFHKIEGKIDEDGDGEFEKGLALHIGSDQAFRQIDLDKNISIDSENRIIKVVIDLKEALKIGDSHYDILARPQIHSLEHLPHALPILDKLTEHITIQE